MNRLVWGLIIFILCMAANALALDGPGAYQVSIATAATDTVDVSPGRNVLHVYCDTGLIRVQPLQDTTPVNLIESGTDMSTYAEIPAGATVPIYGKFNRVVITSQSGGTSTGWLWLYKE